MTTHKFRLKHTQWNPNFLKIYFTVDAVFKQGSLISTYMYFTYLNFVSKLFQLFKRQLHKTEKHSNCLSVFDHFVELVLKWLTHFRAMPPSKPKLYSILWHGFIMAQIMFKNRLPICDIFVNPYICWDKFWSVSSTAKFTIPWKSQGKILYIDISRIYGGYVKIYI